MKQEITIKEGTVILDTETVYSGKGKPDETERLVRKAIGLPVEKQLVYYKDKANVESVIGIKTYQLVEMFNITNRWYTVEIILGDNTVIHIHSGYLIEMQKKSFVADMASQNV